MATRNAFCTTLCLFMLLGLCNPAAAQSILDIPNEQKYEKLSIEELTNQIRRDKYDQILPKVMREHGIDMWIHVMREGNVHSFGNASLLCSQ